MNNVCLFNFTFCALAITINLPYIIITILLRANKVKRIPIIY